MESGKCSLAQAFSNTTFDGVGLDYCRRLRGMKNVIVHDKPKNMCVIQAVCEAVGHQLEAAKKA
jgi:membrane-associated PAP2 superfamily phosphatase